MHKDLESENKTTNQPPVFIGPLLMHQHKDWKTYSRFANSLIAEKLEVDSLVACGKDGEKALTDEFQLDLQYFCTVLFISKEKDRNLKLYIPRNISFTCRKYLESQKVHPNFMDL